MDEQRRQTIIKEIDFWKRNNMLPTQYCDYLLAIYSKEHEQQLAVKEKRTASVIEIFIHSLFLMMIFFAIVCTFIYPVSFFYQIGLFFIMNGILVISYFVFKRFDQHPLTIYLTAAFLLLIFEVQINEYIFTGNITVLYIILFINSLIWLLIGIINKMKLFLISGSVTIPIILFFLFNRL